MTSGTPLAMLVRNQDHRSADYSSMEVKYRPSHADATYDAKYPHPPPPPPPRSPIH